MQTLVSLALAATLFRSLSPVFIRAENTQESRLGCSTAYYMLRNSIPASCNSALERITASLHNISEPVESGDICTSYCITPLKQAALECQAIEDIYSAISLRCCRNHHRQKCFSLSGHDRVVKLIDECGHYNISNIADNCTATCALAMAEANLSLGCCLHALLLGSSYQSLLEPALWQWCTLHDPAPHCTECSGVTSCSAGLAGLAVAAALSGTLQL